MQDSRFGVPQQLSMETSPYASRNVIVRSNLKTYSGSTSARLHHACCSYILSGTRMGLSLMDLGCYGDQAATDINGSVASSNNVSTQSMRQETGWSHKWEAFDEWKRLRELVMVPEGDDEESSEDGSSEMGGGGEDDGGWEETGSWGDESGGGGGGHDGGEEENLPISGSAAANSLLQIFLENLLFLECLVHFYFFLCILLGLWSPEVVFPVATSPQLLAVHFMTVALLRELVVLLLILPFLLANTLLDLAFTSE